MLKTIFAIILLAFVLTGCTVHNSAHVNNNSVAPEGPYTYIPDAPTSRGGGNGSAILETLPDLYPVTKEPVEDEVKDTDNDRGSEILVLSTPERENLHTDSNGYVPYEGINEEELRQRADSLMLAGYNDSWIGYMEYRQNFMQDTVEYPARIMPFNNRVMIHVVDRVGNPVANQKVTIEGRSRQGTTPVTTGFTYATGNFPVYCLNGVEYVARVNQRLENFYCQGQEQVITFKVRRATPTQKLDLLFLIDSTGSMSDEIRDLQTNINSVAGLIAQEGIDVQYTFVSYRDHGDEYVTMASHFTGDISRFENALHSLDADGGGDYPEMMSVGMEIALAQGWREDAIKIIVLIADAPPKKSAYYNRIIDSLRQGIKFYTVAASGLDPHEGEFIFRQIAALTEGKFVFLTYEDSASQSAPGTETGHHVGDYSVGRLDALLVRLITDEMSHQLIWSAQ